jgi:hypothetical protein
MIVVSLPRQAKVVGAGVNSKGKISGSEKPSLLACIDLLQTVTCRGAVPYATFLSVEYCSIFEEWCRHSFALRNMFQAL